jgi:environmental stress-induced protein Ves
VPNLIRFRVIKYSDYVQMPWKNGMGSTLEIDVSEDKVWRLSAATVQQSSSFSDYSGFDRLLTVWKGDGLLLNDFLLKKNEVHAFAGEDLIYCKNLNEQVTDLGLIFKRDRVQAQMITQAFTDDLVVTFAKGIHFIFCLEGQFATNDHLVQQGDTLRIENEALAQILLKSAKTVVAIIDLTMI